MRSFVGACPRAGRSDAHDVARLYSMVLVSKGVDIEWPYIVLNLIHRNRFKIVG